MSQPDFSNYEKRLSVDHEQKCRTTCTIHGAWESCAIRKCRRDRACTGPMLRSAYQDGRVRAQREIGLTGNACARLPACVARAERSTFQFFDDCLDDLAKDMIAHPDEKLPSFDRKLKGRQSPQGLPNP